MGQFVRLLDDLSTKSRHTLPNPDHFIDFEQDM